MDVGFQELMSIPQASSKILMILSLMLSLIQLNPPTLVNPFLSIEKVDIGAFRVYSNNYRELACPNKKDVPRRKMQDMGYHYQRYYELPVILYND